MEESKYRGLIEMETIDKSNPRYSEIVDDYSNKEYDIDSNKMQSGDEIICPHDNDMKILKNADGTVSVIKSCYAKKPFSK